MGKVSLMLIIQLAGRLIVCLFRTVTQFSSRNIRSRLASSTFYYYFFFSDDLVWLWLSVTGLSLFFLCDDGWIMWIWILLFATFDLAH